MGILIHFEEGCQALRTLRSELSVFARHERLHADGEVLSVTEVLRPWRSKARCVVVARSGGSRRTCWSTASTRHGRIIRQRGEGPILQCSRGSMSSDCAIGRSAAAVLLTILACAAVPSAQAVRDRFWIAGRYDGDHVIVYFTGASSATPVFFPARTFRYRSPPAFSNRGRWARPTSPASRRTQTRSPLPSAIVSSCCSAAAAPPR